MLRVELPSDFHLGRRNHRLVLCALLALHRCEHVQGIEVSGTMVWLHLNNKQSMFEAGPFGHRHYFEPCDTASLLSSLRLLAHQVGVSKEIDRIAARIFNAQ